MNEVKKILEKGKIDFATGLALLKKYCDNEGIISLVEKKRNLQYLTFELKRLARKPHLKPNRHYVDLDLTVLDGPSHIDEPKGEVEDLPKQEAPSRIDDPNGEDDGDKIVDWHKLEHYQNTKYDDMPNDFCKKIYKENMDLYKELQHNHQQMKLANSDEGRAAFRKEVLRLDEAITSNWKIIDDEIASLKSDSENNDSPVEDVKESTLRSRITRALKKETLSNEELVELRSNFAIALQKELKFSDETNAKLKELGVID
ncbi:MAG: hypothetical protein IJA42_02695 [Bacteroidales bacterium]|nr:hypothetical protein [Bacteroidales bacterium]